MLIQGQVGPVTSTASANPGSQPPLRQGNMTDLIVSELHGRYYEGAYRRARFQAANQAGVTTSVGFATTYVGIVLSNPVGNTNNLIVEKVGVGFLVAFAAAAAVGVAVGYNSSTNVTHTTPITPTSAFVGIGAAPTGKVDSAATLPTAPTAATILGAGLTGAITTAPAIYSEYDLEGSIILPPGGYLCTFTSTASGASGFWGSIQWEEVPI